MKPVLIIFLIVFIIIVLAVTIPILLGRNTSRNSGDAITTLYKSSDGGETWEEVPQFPGGSINIIREDASDPNIILVGTERKGIWRGNLSEKSWGQYKQPLGEGTRVFDILKPARSEDMIALVFSRSRGRVIRRLGEETSELLFASEDNFAFLSGKISGGMVRVAGSDGGFYESRDGGERWSVLSRFRQGLTKIEVNPQNLSEIWAADARGSFYRSNDGGKTWKNLTSGLRPFKGSNNLNALAFEPRSGMLYHISDFGLLESRDKGESWKEILLPLSRQSSSLSVFATAPSFGRLLWAGALKQIYISSDGGLSWRASEIPKEGTVSAIMASSADPNLVFVGFKVSGR